MTDASNGAAVANGNANGNWAASSRVYIADLQQERRPVSDQYLEASVFLVWPYSSSTRKFSLLVAELDVRRGAGVGRRQVKVTFHNGAAKAAQESRVGIGDTVRVYLDGCRYERGEERDQVSTPGKRLDFDVVFTRTLRLEVNPGQGSERTVNYTGSGVSPCSEPSPTIHGAVDLSGSIAPFPTEEIPIQLSSPASRKSLRMSSASFMEATLDPFAEDKDYLYGGRRKRTKFARESASWRLLDDSDEDDNVIVVEAGNNVPDVVESATTPVPVTQPTQHEHVESALQSSHLPPESVRLLDPTNEPHSQVEVPSSPPTSQVDGRAEDLMPPPQWRPQPLPQDARHIELPGTTIGDVTTPRLRPIPSPGLSLVSPLVTEFGGVDGGFLFSGRATVSENDASPAHPHNEAVAIVPEGDIQAAVPDSQGAPTEDLHPVDGQEISVTFPQLPDLPGPEAQSPKPATDMLDVLERFLQMSPTNSEPVQMLQPSGSILSATGGSEEGNDEANDHTPSASLAVSINEADDNDELPSPVELVSDQDDVQSSTSDQSPTGDTDSVESEPSPASAALVNEADFLVEGQSSTLEADVDVTSHTSANESLRDARDGQPTSEVAEPDQSLHESNSHSFLPTPAQTQEEQEVNSAQGQLLETPQPATHHHPQPPTPTQSQANVETKVHDVDGTADPVADSVDNIVSINRRLLTQEGMRLSEAPHQLSSPYFILTKHPVPDELANSPTLSPSKQQPIPDRRVMSPPSSPISKRQARLDHGQALGLTTSVAYYAPLSSLHEHFNQLVDIIAVCGSNSTPPRQAKRGQKDWYTTLHIADPSYDVKDGSVSGRTAQIFRFAKEALPSTKRGDGIILRAFKVETRKHETSLVSTDSSSWAVFDGSVDERSMVGDAVVTGPPLEYGRGETAYLRKMARWWADEGHDLFPENAQDKAHDKIDTAEHNADATRRRRSSIQQQRRSQSLSINTQEAALQSIEEPPKSPVRTRRRAQMAEEEEARAVDGEDGSHGAVDGARRTEQPSATPSRRRSSRATKTPSGGGGGGGGGGGNAGPGNLLSVSVSVSSQGKASAPPPPPSSSYTHRRRSTRGSPSPNLVHELRDGKEYVDDNGGGGTSPRSQKQRSKDVRAHELRNGTKYWDGE